MPTKRIRRTRSYEPPVSAAMLALLRTGQVPWDLEGGFDAFLKSAGHARPALAEDWRTVRAELLAEWIREAPGTRPWAWWTFDAPRWRRDEVPARQRGIGDVYLDWLAEPRRRVGGTGTPSFEVLNYVPRFESGLPVDWVTDWQVSYYNGRSRDIHGRPIGQEYHEGYFAGLAPDPDDPPMFESEAAYLDRHGLLTVAERRRLPASAFEPVRLEWAPEAEE